MQGEIVQASSPADVRDIRELLLEYASSLGFSLCFQSFDKELAGLPGDEARTTAKLRLEGLNEAGEHQ